MTLLPDCSSWHVVPSLLQLGGGFQGWQTRDCAQCFIGTVESRSHVDTQIYERHRNINRSLLNMLVAKPQLTVNDVGHRESSGDVLASFSAKASELVDIVPQDRRQDPFPIVTNFLANIGSTFLDIGIGFTFREFVKQFSQSLAESYSAVNFGLNRESQWDCIAPLAVLNASCIVSVDIARRFDCAYRCQQRARRDHCAYARSDGSNHRPEVSVESDLAHLVAHFVHFSTLPGFVA